MFLSFCTGIAETLAVSVVWNREQAQAFLRALLQKRLIGLRHCRLRLGPVRKHLHAMCPSKHAERGASFAQGDA